MEKLATMGPLREMVECQTALFLFLADAAARDPLTMGHCWAVGRFSAAIAENMNLPLAAIADCFLGGVLHDIGRVAVPSDVSHCYGRLNEGQKRFLIRHPGLGRHLCESIGLSVRVCKIVGQHHERRDGTGYPDGLRGDQIDDLSCIVALADTVEGLASTEHGGPPLNSQQIEQLIKDSVHYFGPAACAAAADLIQVGYRDNRWTAIDATGAAPRECQDWEIFPDAFADSLASA